MFTLGELILLTTAVFIIGMVFSVCVSFLYLMIKLINKRISLDVKNVLDQKMTENAKYSIKANSKNTKDDVPFSTPIVKVETSFEDRRIGKV